MIFTIQAAEAHKHPALIAAMHRQRAQVFSERLGWDVDVIDGEERDTFDDGNPLYLLSLDDEGNLRGSLRLLPTTGPTMLRDVFGPHLRMDEDVRSPLIWESTRFCVAEEAMARRTGNRLNYVTGELLAGIVEVGQRAGLQSVASVYDSMMRRVLRTAGCEADEIGTPARIGVAMVYVGLFEISDGMLERIRSAAGIDHAVLTPTSALAA